MDKTIHEETPGAKKTAREKGLTREKGIGFLFCYFYSGSSVWMKRESLWNNTKRRRSSA
jgi:hypothetical protein